MVEWRALLSKGLRIKPIGSVTFILGFRITAPVYEAIIEECLMGVAVLR